MELHLSFWVTEFGNRRFMTKKAVFTDYDWRRSWRLGLDDLLQGIANLYMIPNSYAVQNENFIPVGFCVLASGQTIRMDLRFCRLIVT